MSMTVGELRRLLKKSKLPDDAPVLITGRHCLRIAEAEEMPIHTINEHGQSQMADEREAPNALVFLDTSRS